MSTELPEPVFEGKPTRLLPLGGAVTRIVFGRGTDRDAPQDGSKRVELDPGDTTVSRRHAIIERSDGAWFITDESRLGTTLNGDAFQRERLVYGDRFKIGRYVFQFNVDAIEWLGHGERGAIVAEGLGFAVKGKSILSGIDLAIRPGEFVGILGGSGQGKSTMMNALCGIRPATSGRVTLDGGAVGGGRVGYVPQDDIVHPELVVRDAVLFSARLRLKLPESELQVLVDRTIERLGLAPHASKRVQNLSGGQRKRVSIATELLTRPDVLFLDEPSSGLDPATEESLMSMLQSLTLTGLTVVCTTHVLQRAYLFSRILFIHGGRLVFAGTADDARRHFLMDGAKVGDTMALERSPLDRIYSLLGDDSTTAKVWEEKFRLSPFYRQPESVTGSVGGGKSADARRRSGRVPWWRVLEVLLRRQAKVLSADTLNLVFLLAQALGIGLLVGWVCSDIGLASFLVLIATMWFGCSNGAQQIVAELPIFRRERVCGLGLATYVHSKIIFLGALTLAQAALLAATTFAASHAFHPRDFDAAEFERRIIERLAPPPDIATTDAASGDVFEVIDESAPATEPPSTASATTPAFSEPSKAAEPDAPGAWEVGTLSLLANWFDLGDNLLESGRGEIRDDRGTPLKRADGSPLMREGRGVWRVAFTALSLRVLAVGGAAVVGVMLGLTISALVRNVTQAVMWVPLILIPQILFGGYVVSLADMSSGARAFSQLMPSAALEKIMEVSQIYGAATPFLSNRTKTPLFLTSDAAKESVEWEVAGAKFSQDYDKLSQFNTAWQNLAVHSDRLGQHKHESTMVAGTTRKIHRDTVTSRRDVKYLKGTPYLHLGAASAAGWTLAAWLAVCLAGTLAGLRSKQTT